MPGVPCDWLSETAIVLNGSGTPPAVATPSQTWRDSSSWFKLHGIVPVHVEQTPTIGPSSARRVDAERAEVRAARGRALGRRYEPGASPVEERVLVHGARLRRMSRIRLGLLSTASINGAVLAVRAEDAPFEVVAVASRDAARAQAYAHEHGIAAAHGSYDELLEDPDVDAVYIALPNAHHHAWTMRALAAGKHVLCEKPYTRRPDEVDEAWDEAERRGLVLTEGLMWRHARQTTLIRELLPRVGRLRTVHATFCGALMRPDDVRWVRELGGGALLDLGCYCISAARLVAGAEPDRVQGEAQLHGEVDGSFAGTLHFEDVTATFQCSLLAPLVNTIEVIGAEGVLRVPNAFVDPPGVVLLNGEEHRVDAGDHYRDELDDFCAAIRGEHPVLIDRDEMRGQARVLDALLRGQGSD